MEVTSLIFDGSGVITDEFPRKTAEMWSKKYTIPFDAIWQTIYLDNYYLARDGKLDAHEYYKKSVEKLNMEINYEEFFKDYITDNSVRPEMLEILKILSQKIPLYLFSNQTGINTKYLRPLLKPYFKYMFFSNEVKMHKPDKQSLDLLIKNMQTNPKDSLYIDDREEPLGVAKAYSIPTYHFISVPEFKKELIRQGLL
jgi:HAD superfamily hydrolase (TIGR01509 family)